MALRAGVCTLRLIFFVARHLLYVEWKYKPDLFWICLHMVFLLELVKLLDMNTLRFCLLKFDDVAFNVGRKKLMEWKSYVIIGALYKKKDEYRRCAQSMEILVRKLMRFQQIKKYMFETFICLGVSLKPDEIFLILLCIDKIIIEKIL